ncbi:MAG: ankyrin repeat domain-containing protein [Desulfomonile tiedjei]|uniref:Ankyrin repeat domain-containing protein n=1 Tax=Desulfomonile tiedjei TaxID=2358 RepID=A0A9D6V264_9BACT|nr:ankyrin repeat domain-containing protein [Desulfomonile tiedjei]
MNVNIVMVVVMLASTAIMPGLAASQGGAVTETQNVYLDDQGLVAAAAAGNMKQLRQLLRTPGAVNARNPQGRTPLMAAVINRHPEAVQFLVEMGADVNSVDLDGYSALALVSTLGDDTGRMQRVLKSRGGLVCVSWDILSSPRKSREDLEQFKNALAEKTAQQSAR